MNDNIQLIYNFIVTSEKSSNSISEVNNILENFSTEDFRTVYNLIIKTNEKEVDKIIKISQFIQKILRSSPKEEDVIKFAIAEKSNGVISYDIKKKVFLPTPHTITIPDKKYIIYTIFILLLVLAIYLFIDVMYRTLNPVIGCSKLIWYISLGIQTVVIITISIINILILINSSLVIPPENKIYNIVKMLDI